MRRDRRGPGPARRAPDAAALRPAPRELPQAEQRRRVRASGGAIHQGAARARRRGRRAIGADPAQAAAPTEAAPARTIEDSKRRFEEISRPFRASLAETARRGVEFGPPRRARSPAHHAQVAAEEERAPARKKRKKSKASKGARTLALAPELAAALAVAEAAAGAASLADPGLEAAAHAFAAVGAASGVAAPAPAPAPPALADVVLRASVDAAHVDSVASADASLAKAVVVAAPPSVGGASGVAAPAPAPAPPALADVERRASDVIRLAADATAARVVAGQEISASEAYSLLRAMRSGEAVLSFLQRQHTWACPPFEGRHHAYLVEPVAGARSVLGAIPFSRPVGIKIGLTTWDSTQLTGVMSRPVAHEGYTATQHCLVEWKSGSSTATLVPCARLVQVWAPEAAEAFAPLSLAAEACASAPPTQSAATPSSPARPLAALALAVEKIQSKDAGESDAAEGAAAAPARELRELRVVDGALRCVAGAAGAGEVPTPAFAPPPRPPAGGAEAAAPARKKLKAAPAAPPRPVVHPHGPPRVIFDRDVHPPQLSGRAGVDALRAEKAAAAAAKKLEEEAAASARPPAALGISVDELHAQRRRDTKVRRKAEEKARRAAEATALLEAEAVAHRGTWRGDLAAAGAARLTAAAEGEARRQLESEARGLKPLKPKWDARVGFFACANDDGDWCFFADPEGFMKSPKFAVFAEGWSVRQTRKYLTDYLRGAQPPAALRVSLWPEGLPEATARAAVDLLPAAKRPAARGRKSRSAASPEAASPKAASPATPAPDAALKASPAALAPPSELHARAPPLEPPAAPEPHARAPEPPPVALAPAPELHARAPEPPPVPGAGAIETFEVASTDDVSMAIETFAGASSQGGAAPSPVPAAAAPSPVAAVAAPSGMLATGANDGGFAAAPVGGSAAARGSMPYFGAASGSAAAQSFGAASGFPGGLAQQWSFGDAWRGAPLPLDMLGAGATFGGFEGAQRPVPYGAMGAFPGGPVLTQQHSVASAARPPPRAAPLSAQEMFVNNRGELVPERKRKR